MKRWLRLILQLLSLVLFGAILWLGGPSIWQQILAGNLRDILPSFLLTGLAGMLAGVRLRLVAVAVTERELAPWRRFYYLNMMARAVGLVVPRTLSTVGGKAVSLRALGVSLKRAVWIVLLDTAFDLILLAVLTVPGLLFLQGAIQTGPYALMVVTLSALLAGGLGWVTSSGRSAFFVRWLEGIPWLTSRLHLDPASVIDVMPTRPIALKALGLSMVLNGALVGRFFTIARAVGLVYPFSIFAAGFPLTQLSLVLSVTPGGLGLFDASWYGVLLLGGVPQQDVLIFVIAQRAYLYIFVLIWAGFSTLLSLTVEERGRE